MITEKVCAFFIHVTSVVCECRCDTGYVNLLLLYGTEHGKILFIDCSIRLEVYNTSIFHVYLLGLLLGNGCLLHLYDENYIQLLELTILVELM